VYCISHYLQRAPNTAGELQFVVPGNLMKVELYKMTMDAIGATFCPCGVWAHNILLCARRFVKLLLQNSNKHNIASANAQLIKTKL
jgi:hypothetical protein